jgi:hypothetical protein
LLTYSNDAGTGTFEFAVLNDLDVTKNGSGGEICAVRNLTFRPDSEQPAETEQITGVNTAPSRPRSFWATARGSERLDRGCAA